MSEGKVPSTTLWLVRDGTAIIGTTSIRHELNELLLREGGHIGYSIKPDERGKGYGTEILRLGLLHARNVGLTKVLITCNKENVASARVIQRNGGVLENEVEGKHFIDGIVQRYWIELA